MPRYRVMVHGNGIDVPMEGATHPITGFYTTRTVAAADAERAARAACELVTAEWRERPYAQVNRGALPSLSVEQVTEIGFLRDRLRRPGGYTFHCAGDDDEPVT